MIFIYPLLREKREGKGRKRILKKREGTKTDKTSHSLSLDTVC